MSFDSYVTPFVCKLQITYALSFLSTYFLLTSVIYWSDSKLMFLDKFIKEELIPLYENIGSRCLEVVG